MARRTTCAVERKSTSEDVAFAPSECVAGDCGRDDKTRVYSGGILFFFLFGDWEISPFFFFFLLLFMWVCVFFTDQSRRVYPFVFCMLTKTLSSSLGSPVTNIFATSDGLYTH